MANVIALAKKYTRLVDEKYQKESLKARKKNK